MSLEEAVKFGLTKLMAKRGRGDGFGDVSELIAVLLEKFKFDLLGEF